MKHINILFGACVSLALNACSGGGDADSRVLAVSIEPQRMLLEQIVGDNYQVTTMLPAGANPENFEPTMSQRKQIADAQAYFTVGYLPFESSLANGLGDNAKIVNSSEGISLVHGTHSHGHDDALEADPHVWTSYRNAKTMAANMLAAMQALDPDHAGAYAANAAALTAHLDSLDAATAQTLEQSGAHAFAVWHPSLSYYARDYGLHQIAVGQESKEASLATLRGIIDEAKADSVQVFVYQKAYDSRQASAISDEIGSRLVSFDPLAYDWDAQLDSITHELAR